MFYYRNFTRRNKKKDSLGLLPVIRDLRNGASGNEGYNKTKKDDSLCDTLSSKPMRTAVDSGLHGNSIIFFSISLVFFLLYGNRFVIPIHHLLYHRNGCFSIQVSVHGLFPLEEWKVFLVEHEDLMELYQIIIRFVKTCILHAIISFITKI